MLMSIKWGVTVPSLPYSCSLSKEAVDGQLIIYLSEKKSPSASIRIYKSKIACKCYTPDAFTLSWEGDKETLINSQGNRTGKNIKQS